MFRWFYLLVVCLSVLLFESALKHNYGAIVPEGGDEIFGMKIFGASPSI